MDFFIFLAKKKQNAVTYLTSMVVQLQAFTEIIFVQLHKLWEKKQTNKTRYLVALDKEL